MRSNIEAYYRLWFDTNRIYEYWAKSHGLTINSLFMLHELKKSGGCTQKELCQALFLPKQTVSGMVKQLIENGTAEQKSGEHDGREKIVKLTHDGAINASKILNDLLQWETEVFGNLGAKDAETLVMLWTKLSELLKQSLERRS